MRYPFGRQTRLSKSNAPPDGKQFPMSVKPKVGTWYIVVTCHKCKVTLFLFRDLTDGTGSLSATYLVTCPRCGHHGEYEGRHYQDMASD